MYIYIYIYIRLPGRIRTGGSGGGPVSPWFPRLSPFSPASPPVRASVCISTSV